MIYIFAPAYQVSGGPEALQQMCYYLRTIGKDAVIVFYNIEKDNPMPSRYLIYGNPWITPQEVVDSFDNTFVVPERRPLLLNPIKKSKKVIWWLSKDNFIYEKAPLYKKIKYYIKRCLGIDVISLDTRYCNFSLAKCMHLCGSKYAFEYVKSVLQMPDVRYCVEPISIDFLRIGAYCESCHRKDVVLYNPSKPSALMTNLLKRATYNYKPLKGYTPSELASIYKESKLYVDFGAFPGPERIPKEAVYFGCHILVGFQNAAINDFDVAISEQYKIRDLENVEFVETKIREMLANFDEQHSDFVQFQQKVCKLEDGFKDSLSHIFR